MSRPYTHGGWQVKPCRADPPQDADGSGRETLLRDAGGGNRLVTFGPRQSSAATPDVVVE